MTEQRRWPPPNHPIVGDCAVDCVRACRAPGAWDCQLVEADLAEVEAEQFPEVEG